MNIPAQHRRVRNDREIVATDFLGGNSKFILYNARLHSVEELRPEEFIKAAPGVRRCDFVYSVDAVQQELYVELKGNRLTDALSQLENTLALLRLPLPQKLCFVVLNRSPSSSPEVQRLRRDFEKRTKCKLIVRSRQCEYHLP
ncbi:MAG TPA: hypothetical protein VF598_05950 [Hymenobacter sp.]|jgi:hypothetical protein